jgi:hypothetical protein
LANAETSPTSRSRGPMLMSSISILVSNVRL